MHHPMPNSYGRRPYSNAGMQDVQIPHSTLPVR